MDVTVSTVAESNQEFLKRMKDAMPVQAKIRMQTTLIESEWNVPVMPHQHLGASGGVALVPRTSCQKSLRELVLPESLRRWF